MAGPKKTADSAEKAYAAAAAEVKPSKTDTAASNASVTAQPTGGKRKQPKPFIEAPSFAKNKRPAAVEPPVAEQVKVPGEVAGPPTLAAEPAIAVAEVAPLAASTNVLPIPSFTALKETIMATAPNPEIMNETITTAMSEMQTRARDAYEKGTSALTEATEFAKGNVEAVVESSKIFAAGVQDLGKSYVEEAKSAYETITADVKELAAVKSPTELFQLQSKIVRRNFDSLVATSSKNTDAFIRLASEAFAPLSGRVNLAADKLAKVA